VASSLYDLLRRCHRVELVGLAETVDVRHQDLGLAQLAKRLDQVIRQRGGSDLANLLTRGGQGPPWVSIVAGLCRAADLPVSGDVEAMERTLLEHWVSEAWTQLTDEQKTQAWDELDLPRPMPEDGEELLAIAHEAPQASGVALGTLSTVGPLLALPILGPFAPIATLLYLTRSRAKELLPAVLEIARLRQLALHRVTVGVVGSPSCGKDAAIKAVFGIDSGNIDPVAGSTSTVAITRLPGASALYVVNTPGLGDVVEAVTEEARQVLDLVDVYLYVVNAQGGVQVRERDDHASVLARGRPVRVVVNKVDTLREDDRERFLLDVQTKLGLDEPPLAAAFDPLPALSETPIGVQPVRAWLVSQLVELGKDPAELAILTEASEPPSAL